MADSFRRDSADGSSADPLAGATATVRRMVEPGGCAWHGVQTHESLIPFLIEETAEFVEAVERGLPADEVASELGDVLYQVIFHAAIAERDGEGYDLAAVADRLNEKLIARHPHVFGDRGYMSVEELHAEWERLKEDAAGESRGSRGALDGIPAGMPTLARAAKVVERLKRAGLLDPRDYWESVSVILREVAESHLGGGGPATALRSAQDDSFAAEAVEAEIGDAILSLVIKANAQDIDADRALRGATRRLVERRDSSGG